MAHSGASIVHSILSHGVRLLERQNINGPGRRPDSRDTKWRVADIIYVAVVGTVMLAAFLEWILWLAAFLYCLIKVYKKAENTSIKVLAALMTVLFTVLRAIFLPVMIVTLPLPPQLTQEFPETMVVFLQWFAFWTFAGLLTVPWLICVFQLVTHSVGRARRLKHILNERVAPKVVIVMPCYKEVPDILLRTVDSLVDCEYPPSCLHVFLSFDGDQEDDLYLNTIEKLGVPMTQKTYPKSIDVVYRSTRITVSRFPHGGKRHCQKQTFRLIDKIYATYVKYHDDLFVLFIDSDCILDKVCIQNFMYEMELKPGSKRDMLAMTGVITSTTEKNSLITILQDMEYIHGQLFERSVESGCGAVTCLPGALTILRFSAFRKMAKYYFADKAEQCDDLFDYGKCHLGEDRWLTHLFMIGAKKRYQIQINTGAFCKTEAVQTFRSLLKQRRRWFLGFITNEVCMLTDIRLWRQYPVLCLVRFAQNTIRTTALLFFIMVISLITTSQKISQLPVGFIAVSLGLNWALMLYFAAKLGRFKIILYPVMFALNPFFNWLYMIYGIFTAGQRTWGGPRADAGAADAKTTPSAAIEHAEATGDDLNVIPETFKPALESITRRKSNKSNVQPSNGLEGRFTAAGTSLDGGRGKDEEFGLPSVPSFHMKTPQPRRHSAESYLTTGTRASIVTPRRVESFVNVVDAQAYHQAQAQQPAAGGAALETALETHHAASDLGSHQSNTHRWPTQLGRSSTVPPRTSATRRRPQRLDTSTSGYHSSSSAWSSDVSSPEIMPSSFNPFAPKARLGRTDPVLRDPGPSNSNLSHGDANPAEKGDRLRVGQAIAKNDPSTASCGGAGVPSPAEFRALQADGMVRTAASEREPAASSVGGKGARNGGRKGKVRTKKWSDRQGSSSSLGEAAAARPDTLAEGETRDGPDGRDEGAVGSEGKGRRKLSKERRDGKGGSR